MLFFQVLLLAGYAYAHLLARFARGKFEALLHSALLAAALAWGARLVNAEAPMLVRTGLVLGIYGMTYWLVTWKAGIQEAVEMRDRVFRNRRRAKGGGR